jgi:hypothetical protein
MFDALLFSFFTEGIILGIIIHNTHGALEMVFLDGLLPLYIQEITVFSHCRHNTPREKNNVCHC